MIVGVTIALVAWGAMAFGAVYPWAYWPLVAAAAVTGVAGLCQRPAVAGHAAPQALLVLLAIGCVALGMALQLVPPRPVLSSLSPAADTLLQKYNLPYATALANGEVPERWARHALSLRPEATEQGTDPYGPFVNKHHFAGWMVMVFSLTMGVVSGGIARGMRDVKPDWRHRLLWLSSRDVTSVLGSNPSFFRIPSGIVT